MLALTGLVAAPAMAKVVRGTRGPDRLIGTQRGDTLLGLGSADLLRGGRGGDLMKGGRGDDRIFAGAGFDEVRGNAGNDRIDVRDGKPDYVDCGGGTDTIFVDETEDGTFNCENIEEIEP